MNNLQLVVTILGIVAQLLALAKYIPKTSPGPGGTEPPPPPPTREAIGRRFLDLSFVLLCSTFLSLLLMDSLVISGRAPSPELSTTLAVLTIVVAVSGVMYGAWRVGQSEKVLGFLSLLTLTVLILSPGGPFGGGAPDAGASDRQQGLTLYLPLLALVTLVSATAIYGYGNPLKPTADRPKRLAAAGLLLLLLLAGSSALGRQLESAVMSDPRTPNIGDPAISTLLRSISPWDAATRHRFYQLAAEIALAGDYQRHLQEFRSAQQKVRAAEAETGPNRPFSPLGQYGFTGAASDRFDVLLERITAQAPGGRRAFLQTRMDWVHPVSGGRRAFALPLAGRTMPERFINLGTLRLLHVLDEQPMARRDLLVEFSHYPEPVVTRFTRKDRQAVDASNAPEVIVRFLTGGREDHFHLAALPRFGDKDDDRQLQMQLSLPSEIESALAFAEYSSLALQLIRERNQNPQDTPLFDGITASFGALSQESHESLRRYVAADETPLETIKGLSVLADIDFGALRTPHTAARYVLDENLATYGKALPALPPEHDGLKKLAYDIAAKRNQDASAVFQRLLRKDDREAKFGPLFEANVFEFVRRFDALSAATKKDFFDAVADPVALVVRELAGAASPDTANRTFFDAPLAAFRKLSTAQQDDVLHQMAISIYQPDRAYSLDPFSQMIVQAKVYSDTAALVTAALFMLPVVACCVLAGGLISRGLVARDRMRALVAKELDVFTDPADNIGAPVDLCGRGDVLRNLRSLAERGWSTIGVVGRRGVGKSRILYALSKADENATVAPTVKVWVASPSRFDEADFIASIFERLALSTEATVASFLGAKPLAIRRLEGRSTRIALFGYGAALTVLLAVMWQMYTRLTRVDIVVTWIPVAALLLGSVGLMARHLSLLQPVDLTGWLQRDRAQNPHTVLLYGEVTEALKFLRQRSRFFNAPPADNQQRMVRMVGASMINTLVFLSGLVALYVLISIEWLGLIIAAAAVAVALLRRRATAQHLTSGHGESMMSLIAEYRTFAGMIVYRLRQGALGHSPDRKFSVLVCIDELDKIVEFEEIRGFVRRIKAIFEVPGVYYYVSLAEDTLTALYLGAATGKNEIDSSFDHVVRIPPLSCSVAEEVAARYLTAHAAQPVDAAAARVIATVSFGVPRDIIRRCDEYLARRTDFAHPADFVADIRRLQASLGYELRQLSSAELAAVSGAPLEASLAARRCIAALRPPVDEASHRVLLSVWILSLVEFASHMPAEVWSSLSDRLCSIGYRMPIERAEDVVLELDRLHSAMVKESGVTRVSTTSPPSAASA